MANDEEKADERSDEKEPFFSVPSEDNATASCGSSAEGPGTQIGHYKLLRVLGEGGCGVVYLATQKEPVKREVALKIIKPGMDSKQVIARFEAERQALALLDHPNIAHVFDAGTTDAGRPYFAMEYVKGVPITEHCDLEKLSIEDRLRLFQRVCDGIQHAHQKGVIHRDIKPSNILVSVEGVPKVIDFGVAKAISQPLTERTLVTEQGQLLGTPEYMSPEQAVMTNQDIDTRSDIYSLGVVLYELLTGTLPFDSKTLRRNGIDSIRQIIREQVPPRPSTRLSTAGEEAEKIARNRRTEVSTLTRKLHQELEWIPLKAMRKERTERYRSTSEFADDIQNYLDRAPLIAGPESVIYWIKKFVLRRSGSVAAAAAILASLILGLIVSSTLYFKAEDARTRESTQRDIAEAERDRATQAEQQANRRLADVYEQQGRLHMKMGRIAEALVYLNAACQIDDKRVSLQFLLADGMRKYNASVLQEETAFLPWSVADRTIRASAFAISPNRKFVALMEQDGSSVHVFDTESGKLTAQLHVDKIENLVFTQDGRHIAVKSRLDEAQGYNFQIIEIASQTVKARMTLSDIDSQMEGLFRTYDRYEPDRASIETAYKSIYISPHGNWLAAAVADPNSDKTQVMWWDVESGQCRSATVDLGAPFIKIGFSFDEKSITAAGLRSRYVVWDIETASIMEQGYGDHSIYGDAIDAKGHMYLSFTFGHLKGLGELRHGKKLVSTFAGTVAGEFSPDGRRFITKQIPQAMAVRATESPEYSCAVLWDSRNAQPLAELVGVEVRNWHFTPDSTRIVIEHMNGQIKIWSTEDGSLILNLHPEEGHVVTDVSPDSLWLLTQSPSRHGTAKMWSLRAGEGFEFEVEEGSIDDLSSGWLPADKDGILSFSHIPPKGLPRFNAGGSKLITIRGLEAATFTERTSGEVQKWVQAHVPLRFDAGQIRRASDEEMLEAKLVVRHI